LDEKRRILSASDFMRKQLLLKSIITLPLSYVGSR
jgi:hypothetical protein